MSTPIPAQPNPFTDPNSALRQLNEYYNGLLRDYGEDAIRAMGFGEADFAALQASLRKLQMDPSATPEQHRQAFMQARDILAQKVTTPLASTRAYAQVPQVQRPPQSAADIAAGVVASPLPVQMSAPTQEQLYEYARSVAQGQESLWDPRIGKFVPVPTAAAASPFAVTPEVEVRGVRPEMPVMPVMPAPMVGNGDFRPTAAQLAEYNAGRIKGYWNSDTGVFENPFAPPPMPLYVDPEPPMPVPSASDYIADMALPTPRRTPLVPPPMMGPVEAPLNIADYPSMGVIDNRVGPGFGKPMQPVASPSLSDMLRGSMLPQMQPTPTMPSTAPGLIAPPMQPSMNTQPTINREFNMLRERYADEGLRPAINEYYRGGPVMRYR